MLIVRLDTLDDSGRPLVERLPSTGPASCSAQDQLVVVDDAELHTYLLWETAERQLLRRIESEPNDPTAAVVYAELAYRAERPMPILPALRLAQRALERDPSSAQSRELRARLFGSLVAMLKPDNPAAAPTLPRDVRAGIVEGVASLASGPSDRATALLLRGEHAQTFGDAPGAVAAYQSILDEPALAPGQLRDGGVLRSASDESTRRLRTLVREHGAHLYARYEAEASDALGRMGLWSDASAFEDLARRYPVSATAARALLRAAEAHDRAGQPERAVLALERGLLAARDALITDREVLGELGGRLVLAIQKTGRYAAASQALARLLSEYGRDLPLSAMGETIDVESLRTTLAGLASDATRLARVGPINESAEPQALLDWSIVEPLVRDAGAPARSHAVLSTVEQFALFAPTPDAGLRVRWQIPRTQADALVRLDDNAAYFTVDSPQGRVITRLDARSGEEVWATPAFRSIFASRPGADSRLAQEGTTRTPPSIDTPVMGRRALTELLVVFDERTMALVERSGRAAAFDLVTGSPLWSRDDLPAEVYDIAAEAGVLVLGGAHAPRDPNQQHAARIATVLSIDLRTGRTIHETRPDAGRPLGQARRTGALVASTPACTDAFRGPAGSSARPPSADHRGVGLPRERLRHGHPPARSSRSRTALRANRSTRRATRPRRPDPCAHRRPRAFASMYGLIVFGQRGEMIAATPPSAPTPPC